MKDVLPAIGCGIAARREADDHPPTAAVGDLGDESGAAARPTSTDAQHGGSADGRTSPKSATQSSAATVRTSVANGRPNGEILSFLLLIFLLSEDIIAI